VIAFHTEHYLKHMDAVLDAGMEVVLGGDDLGQKTGPMLRPAMIEEFLGDSYRQVAAKVHDRGAKLIWHSCGNIYQLLDMFVDWGFDGIITMEPTADMDVARVREQVGHKLALIGNLDVSHLLVKGSKQEIDEAVKQAIAGAANGGGYVLSAAHSHSLIDPERLEWMIEAGKKYGAYPLQVA
jgi:uroporphyrinogen decarboxylase